MYNKSKIFKRAWELVKKANMSLKEALKFAWRVAKFAIAVSNREGHRDVTFKFWQGYGHIRYYYKIEGMSKYYNSKRDHFIEYES